MGKVFAIAIALTLILAGCSVKQLTEKEYKQEMSTLLDSEFNASMMLGTGQIDQKETANKIKKVADRMEKINPPSTIEARFPGQHDALVMSVKLDAEFYIYYYEFLKTHEENDNSYDGSYSEASFEHRQMANALIDFLEAE